MKLTLWLALVFFNIQARAATFIPTQLDEADRYRAAQILGFGSMPKLLSSPYPLGGYSGVEVGFSTEFISLKNVASLGSTSPDEGDYTYYTLSLGKGLFNNVDLFLHFTPLPQSEGVSSFGGQVRWGLYETSSFPFALSLVFNGGGSSFSGLINSSHFGADLVGVVTLRDVSLYVGGGRARAITTFVGGANGITDDGNKYQVNLVEAHTLIGVHFKISKFFLAVQMDRYVESNYSGRLGMRF